MGFALTDENDNIITFETKEQYQLWMSQAIFNGKGEKLTDWSEPIKMGEDLITKEEIVRGMGYLDYKEMIAKAKEGKTIISGGYINTELIEAKKLRVGEIETIPVAGKEKTKVVIDNEGARIGEVVINSAGHMVIGSNGEVVIKDTDIQSVTDLIGGASSGEVNLISKSIRDNSGSVLASPVLNVPSNNSTLVIERCRILAEASCGDAAGTLDDYYSKVDAVLLRNGSYYGLLGSVNQRSGQPYDPVNPIPHYIDINKTLIVPKGAYTIRMDVYVEKPNPLVRPYTLIGLIAYLGGTMRFDYVDSSIMQMEIGRNGMIMAVNTDNYEHTIIKGGKLKKTFKGELDMPGFLCKARIVYGRIVEKKSGAFSITDADNKTNGQANKRITHNVGHDGYSAICTPYGSCTVARVINETATYVDVYTNGDFNIILLGDN